MTQPTARLLHAALILGAFSFASAVQADTASLVLDFDKQTSVDTPAARDAAEKMASIPSAAPAATRRGGNTVSQRGKASWYGPGFHGRRTASGERFDKNALTAAHKTLPFGTKVRVVNNRNGRSVVVRINDRGPFVHNRIIDLSHASAQVIGLTSAGIGEVTIGAL